MALWSWANSGFMIRNYYLFRNLCVLSIRNSQTWRDIRNSVFILFFRMSKKILPKKLAALRTAFFFKGNRFSVEFGVLQAQQAKNVGFREWFFTKMNVDFFLRPSKFFDVGQIWTSKKNRRLMLKKTLFWIAEPDIEYLHILILRFELVTRKGQCNSHSGAK